MSGLDLELTKTARFIKAKKKGKSESKNFNIFYFLTIMLELNKEDVEESIANRSKAVTTEHLESSWINKETRNITSAIRGRRKTLVKTNG